MSTINKSTVSIGLIAVLFIALVFTLSLSQQRQEQRGRASGTTTFGTTSIGSETDSGDGNSITCNKYASSTTGTVSSMSVYVTSVDPNSKSYSLALYEDNSGNPANLLGSGTGTLTSNAWNTVSLSIPVSAGTSYWLCYNSSTTNSSYNNMKYSSGSTPAIYKDYSYGSWPSTFGTVGARWTDSYSIYATVTTVTPTNTPTAIPTNVPTTIPTVLPTSGPNLVSQGQIQSHDGCNRAYSYINNLVSGNQYKIIISGVMDHNNDSSPNYHIYRDPQWVDEQGVCQNCFTKQAYVTFNDQFPRAIDAQPSYRSDHTYTFMWTADSNQLALSVGDSNYCDNSGFFTYQVYDVSVPTNTPTPSPTSTPTPTLTKTPTPTNTPTPTVTPTPLPNATKLDFTLLLHGLGNGGDSANPTSEGNFELVHPDRAITVEIFNSQNQPVLTKTGTLSFNSSTGRFAGVVDLGTTFTNGIYTVKVKTDQFLKNLIPGIQTITSGTTNTMPITTLISGDINNDNVISILDYNILIGCYSDLLPAVSCTEENNVLADLTDDGHVNQYDYNLFLRELTNVGGQ